jgi:uncharacterized protein with PQ loop repeat
MINEYSGSLVWISQTLYFVSFIPQIIKNYSLKSGKGLSILLLAALFNAYIAFLFYLFIYNFPLGYKVNASLQLAATTVLIIQKFYYNGKDQRKKIGQLSLVSVLILTGLSLISMGNKHIAKNVAGWLAIFFFATNRIPQMLKIYSEESTQGFSFLFISIYSLGAMLELVVVYLYSLPIQTLLYSLGGILTYIIFCIQFFIYKKRIQKN